MTPASIWQLPELRKISEDQGAKRVAIHQYHYGASFPKPTGILATIDLAPGFGVEGWPEFSGTGEYTGPLTRIAAPPMKLGPENTAPTAEYPAALARTLAEMAVSTLLRRSLGPPDPVGGDADGSRSAVQPVQVQPCGHHGASVQSSSSPPVGSSSVSPASPVASSSWGLRHRPSGALRLRMTRWKRWRRGSRVTKHSPLLHR